MVTRQKAVVALGTFDGVHLGHRALLKDAVALAKNEKAISAVYTFSNHPLELFGKTPKLLMSAAQREETIRKLGVLDVVMQPFTEQVAHLCPEDFVRKLFELWDVCAVVVGFNYTFGDRALGTPDILRTLGERYGFETVVHAPVLIDEETVSSTRIRSLIEDGQIEHANVLLDAPYRLEGKVIANLGNGKKLGFPTANIDPDACMVKPLAGVYATDAVVGGKTYRAVTNIGNNPTFGAKKTTVETHLLDFDGELYGEKLVIAFLKRLRGEIRFDSLEMLKEQIAQDAKTARRA